MDGTRFEALTRHFARGVSRRTALRGLAGAVAGGGLALVRRNRSEAFICRQPGVLCATNAQCCSGLCDTNTARCFPEGGCPSESPDICSAAEGCTNLLFDKQNCGRCGHSCGPNGFCYYGACYQSAAIPAPIARVWRAMTEPNAISAWGPAGDFAPVVGHQFTLHPSPQFSFSGEIRGEVVAVEAPRKLVLAWHAPELAEPVPVTIELAEDADGKSTRVMVRQESGTSAPCRLATQRLGAAWQQRLFADSLGAYASRSRLTD